MCAKKFFIFSHISKKKITNLIKKIFEKNFVF